MCINHVLYADDICLLAPSASAMQSLLDVCYEYGTDNDILFHPIKSVCTVFKPKAYKRFTPTVFIGDDALKFTKDYCMQSLTHYYGHLKLLCFKAIVRHCIVLFCGTIIKSLHLVKFVSRLTMLKGTDHVSTFMGLKCVVYYANYRSGNQSSKIQVVP